MMDIAANYERLIADAKSLEHNEIIHHCEGCGAWLTTEGNYILDSRNGIG